MTPFFRLRHSSAEKEDKSASWIIGSSKFFAPIDLFHKSRVAELFHRTCWVRPSDSHGALAKIRFLDLLCARCCRWLHFVVVNFALAYRVNSLRSCHSSVSLFTNWFKYSKFLLFRDAIFFSSPQLAKKRRQIRLLDYWRSQGLVFRFKFLF